jgi:heterodisulfide reductase subunit B
MFGEGAKAPVLYFSQLMGIAMGIGDNVLGMQRLMNPLPSANMLVSRSAP